MKLSSVEQMPGGGAPVAGKISVLAVTNTYPTEEAPGDTPCVKDHILALRAKGVDVDLLHVDRSKGKQSYARAAWRLLLASFQSKRYDLVHAYYGHCGLLARLQLRYPLVVTFRGSDLLSRRDGAIGRVVARPADGVISVMSEEMRQLTAYPLDPVHGPPRPGEVFRICLDANKAKKELEWSPTVGLQEGLERTLGYFKEQLATTEKPGQTKSN